MKTKLFSLILLILPGVTLAEPCSFGWPEQESGPWRGISYVLQVPCDVPSWDTTKPLPIQPQEVIDLARNALSHIIGDTPVYVYELSLKTWMGDVSKWFFRVSFAEKRLSKDGVASSLGTVKALVLMDRTIVIPRREFNEDERLSSKNH